MQNKITALHHLDVPWKPSDLKQTNGRGIRQGNENAEVDIFYYVTEKTFDAYSYQLLENKQKFISQIMTSKIIQRSAEDIDKEALSYAEIKALTTGNPLIIEKMELETDVSKLKLLKQDYLSQKYSLEDAVVKFYPVKISSCKQMIKAIEQDINIVKANTNIENEEKFSSMKIKDKMFYKKELAGKEILEMCKTKETVEPEELGIYRGLKMFLEIENKEFKIKLKANATYSVSLGNDANGNILRLDNAIENMSKELEKNKIELENIEQQFTNAQIQLEEEFQYEDELAEKQNKLSNINALLNVDKEENVIIDDEIEENKDTSKNKEKDKDYER